jgi:sarcosine oxidase
VTYDVIVVGVGAMGSAALYHLAARGRRVLGLEQHAVNHTLGSSHGLTRIIRLAYFEHPSYVPLLRRAFELWGQLEERSRAELLHVTGALDIGQEGSTVFEGSRRSCFEHGLTHEVLDAQALMRRVPAWQVPPDTLAVLQPDGGFLAPERCIDAHVDGARAAGATVLAHHVVRGWTVSGGGVRVHTDTGTFEAGQLVLSAGAWAGSLVPTLAPWLRPERQVVGWFEVADSSRFTPMSFPVFVHEAAEGLFYGFPEHGVPGFKIGKYHHLSQVANPDAVDRACNIEDERALRAAVGRYLPSANGPLLQTSVCLFTNTPDGHFLIDRDPAAPEVLWVSACSGHGFKFSSVIGEIVADLVVHDATVHDIGLFAGRRLLLGKE